MPERDNLPETMLNEDTKSFFAKLQVQQTISAPNQDITDRVEQKMQAHISEVVSWPSGKSELQQQTKHYPTGPADRPDVVWNNEQEEAEWWDKNEDYVLDAFKKKYEPDISKMQERITEMQKAVVEPASITKVETHQEIVASIIPNLPKNHVLFAPFENNTGIANFGHGSFTGMNVKDLRGNVVVDEKGKAETTQETIKVPESRQANLPLLRYINFESNAIELRFHQDGTKKISAFKVTQHGKVFTQIADRLSADDLLVAISERALGYPGRLHSTPEHNAQKTLEDVTTLSDEE